MSDMQPNEWTIVFYKDARGKLLVDESSRAVCASKKSPCANFCIY